MHAMRTQCMRPLQRMSSLKRMRPLQKMSSLNRIAKEMMNDVRRGHYPLYGVTALAGCRPLELFTRQAAAEPAVGMQQQQQQQEQQQGAGRAAGGWEVGAAGKLSRAQVDALRNQDPIEGWW